MMKWYGGGECNLVWVMVALTAQTFTYMIDIFTIFRHYAILYHFISLFATWHGEKYFMPAKNNPVHNMRRTYVPSRMAPHEVIS